MSLIEPMQRRSLSLSAIRVEKQTGFVTPWHCSPRLNDPRLLNLCSESRQLLVWGAFGWRLQELEQFYREVHGLEGKHPKFPDSYPTSALLGTVNVINCVEARVIAMLNCQQFQVLPDCCTPCLPSPQHSGNAINRTEL